MTKIISFLNQKGGVGKTTSTINVGAGLCELGKKVLLVDFDSQASLSCSLSIESPKFSIYHVLKKEINLEDTVIKKSKFFVVPGSIDLSVVEHEYRNTSGKEQLLKNALKNTKYDYVLIDCPPSLGLLTINALVASHEVCIPVVTEFLALEGLGQLVNTVSLIKEKLNPALKINGIIATRYNRRKINKDVIRCLHDNFNKYMFNTIIRENVSLTEAPSFGEDIFTHKPSSMGAHDYMSLCKEIVER